MSFAAVAAAVVGGGIGLGASALGADANRSAANTQADATLQASREQRDYDQNNSLKVMGQQLIAMFGNKAPGIARQFLSADDAAKLFGVSDAQYGTWQQNRQKLHSQITSLEQQYRDAQAAGADPQTLADLDRQASSLRSQRDELDQRLKSRPLGLFGGRVKTGGNAGSGLQRGGAGGNTAGGGPQGFLGQMEGLVNQFVGENNNIQGGYDLDTNTLQRMGQENLDATQGFGDARKQEISRDLGRSQSQEAARINSIMRASGMGGSSLNSQAMAGAMAKLFEQAGSQKNAINDQYQGLTSAIRESNINRLGSRMSGGTQLRSSINNQNQQLRQQPLQAQMNMLFGPAFNGMAGRNSQSYFPGVTGAGVGQASLGGLLPGLGQNFATDLSPILRRLFSGTGNQNGGSNLAPNGYEW